jgi:hypothetical protein
METAPYFRTAISVGTLIDTLLYFDYVVPINGALGLYKHLEETAERYTERDIKSFLIQTFQVYDSLIVNALPPELRNTGFEDKIFQMTKLSITTYLEQIKENLNEDRLDITEIKHLETRLKPTLDSIFEHDEMSSYPLCLRSDMISNADDEERSELAVTIASLKLIDTKKVTLDHLRKFREDTEVKIKLRRLRLFAYENYTGKNRAFVEETSKPGLRNTRAPSRNGALKPKQQR